MYINILLDYEITAYLFMKTSQVDKHIMSPISRLPMYKNIQYAWTESHLGPDLVLILVPKDGPLETVQIFIFMEKWWHQWARGKG